MDKWIDVKNRLPEDDWLECLVMCPEIGNHYSVLEATFCEGRFYRNMIINHNNRRISNIAIVVDYWIEIPKVPEVNDD